AEDGIRDATVTGVQTCALPIYECSARVGVINVVLNQHAATSLRQSVGADDDGTERGVAAVDVDGRGAAQRELLCADDAVSAGLRSEERRVGKERWRRGSTAPCK